jgi:hypothetical protein
MEIEKTSRQLISLNKLEEYKDSDQFLGPHGPRYGLCTDYRGQGTVVPYSDCYETRFFDDSLAAEFLKFVLVKLYR